MVEFVSIGACPTEEDCVQVGSQDYARRAREQSLRFIALIRQKLGREPPGATLQLKWADRDFGRYCEVVCYYEIGNKEATDYAFRCESDAPPKWE
jgi:hypothetical protein